MLESIREGSKKPWAKYFIFAIAISFIFAGGFSVSSLLGDPNAAAVVNGESISRNEFQRAYANVKASQADFYAANVKTEEDEIDFQENVLQQLITETVIKQSLQDLGMRISQPKLRDVIQSEPNYQLEGKYSAGLVEQTIARAGISREKFKQFYADREVRNQINSGLFQSDFSLESEVRKGFELMGQKRTGRAIKINNATFEASVDVSDEDIAKYYEDNQETYRIEEKVSIEYLELSVEKLIESQQPTEEQLELYYRDNVTRFQSAEQRQYSHILVLSNDDETAAEKRAQSISERIQAGEDFAEIAKAESDDAPTKDSGGDLGVLLEGTLDQAAEDAAKLLTQEGQVTPPVKLEFGYQFLKLTKIIPGTVQALEDVKDELLPELKKQLAEETFYSKLETLKEKTFEFADSLAEAAAATELEIQTSDLFGRSAKKGIFANQQLKDAAFSTDVVEGMLNSSAIEINDKQVVVLRLKEHKASEIQPLDTVKEKVKKALVQSRAKESANSVADILMAKLESGEAIDELMQTNNLSWIDLDQIERNNSQLSYMANAQFFKMAPPKENQSTVDLAEDFQGTTVLLLNKVEKADWEKAESKDKEQRELYYTAYFSNAGFESYKKQLRNDAEVSRNLNNIRQ